MTTRRALLAASAPSATLMSLMPLMGAAGLLPAPAQAAWNPSAFEAKSLVDVVKALGGSPPVESKDITLTGPDIAENGAAVQVACATALPGVKRLALLVEKNPNVLVAVFDLSDAVDAHITTRVKMGQSSKVFAVALMADGRVLFAAKDIKVTLGGCGA